MNKADCKEPDDAMTRAGHVLKEVFGFEAFRPGQEAVMACLLAGRRALVVMPTGSGKSLCFQVPALVMGGLSVVVSPLIALMQDQVAALRLAGVAADSIHSGNSSQANVAAWRRAAQGETRLLYMAPERLMTERMLVALAKLPLRMFAIDEAHCVSQWGPAFRPEYQGLAELRSRFPDVPVAALTATADKVTRDDIAAQLFGGEVQEFVLGFDRPNIQLSVEMKQDWKSQLSRFVVRHEGESGIVYCLSRRKTEETAEFLNAQGVRALPYHAGMEKSQRQANQDIFMTDPGVVMVATIAFGMGIDKADVRYVFHTDLPGSTEAYYQEIGRAGRDGDPAQAHMLYGLADIGMRRRFIEQEEAGEERSRREHKRLDALLGYCEAPSCRRVTLLDYFGEASEPCGNCDCCLHPVDRVDATRDAQKILSAVYRTGERFGAAHVIDILRGIRTEKIQRMGHDRLPTFGVGEERGKNDWRSLIRQLVATGFLRLDIAGYGGLAITNKGRKLLRGEEQFLCRPDIAVEKSARKKPTPPVALALDERDEALFLRLKALRLELAQQRGVPAYVVFPDRTLQEMARIRPSTHSEFADLNGVGAVKLKDFADAFLAAIHEETAEAE